MAKSIVNIKNLIGGYDSKAVISDVDFSISEGEIITLVGSNGSGKTTLLKTICNQLKPLGGTVYLDMTDIRELSNQEIAKKCAVVFREDNIKEPVTCFDFIAMGRYPYTNFLGKLKDEDLKQVEEAMKLTQVEDFKEKTYMKLSDGQKQRVLLARALCQNPKVLILDEPTTYLDIRFKLEFLSMLYRLAKKKRIAIIMSLHELDMAKQISDKVVCIKNGKVEKIGTPQEVFTKGYINHLFDISVGHFDEESFLASIVKEL